MKLGTKHESTTSSWAPATMRVSPIQTGLPMEHGFRGTHGIVVSVRDAENPGEFMQSGWNGRKGRVDDRYLRYEVGEGGSGAIVEFRIDPISRRVAGPTARAFRAAALLKCGSRRPKQSEVPLRGIPPFFTNRRQGLLDKIKPLVY
jgi:hypothetical protein